jgi:catechol 2,3-dioxygenase-like lactoylglutathione lyase family enzyme
MRPTLTHLALHVRDIAAMVAFYEEYCGLGVVHDRETSDHRVAWLAEPGHESEFVLVLIGGGAGADRAADDFSHQGFAVGSRAEVDEIARRAEVAGCLAWPCQEEPYPVGYYCGVRDPDGNVVEFSYGQPLGPGAPGADLPA